MKFITAASALLLAGTALALPTPETTFTNSPRLKEKLRARRAERMQKRHEAKIQHNRPLAVNPSSMSDFVSLEGTTTEAQYDSNWAGAVIISSDITEVVGTFTVPTVKEPSGGSRNEEYGSSAWVGIDGDTCGSAILQTGVEFLIEGSETAYDAWYEWYPAYSYNFDDFDVAPGNVIKATVVANSKTSGTATIENVSTGKTVTHTFTNEASEGSLCETNAEWIVEDFESGSELIGFADFGTVTFTGASYTAGGSAKGISGATVLDIEQDGDVLTSCSVASSSSVSCTYQ